MSGIQHSVPVDSRHRAAAWIDAYVAAGRRVFVAEELQMDLTGLSARHDVVEAPLTEFVVRGMRERHADLQPVFVLPTLDAGSRFAAWYRQALRPVASLDELARWGVNGVPRIRSMLVHMGNPRLALYELPPASAGASDE